MNSFALRALAALVSAAACGCTSLSGIDGSSTYACKAPDGVRCDSVSGNYYNALQNNLPSQRDLRTRLVETSAPAASALPNALPNATPTTHRTALTPTPSPSSVTGPAMPLRSGPRILRLWIKPWEDSDRDLNGESVVYVKIDNGQWLVDHAQRRAVEAFAPVRPGRQVAPPRAAASPEARPAQSDAAAVAETLRALQQRPLDAASMPLAPPAPPSPPVDN